MRKRSIKEGDILPSKLCGDFVIKEYVDSENIIIEFIQTGYKTSARLPHIVRGNVKDKMLPDLCGVGYIGDGIYKSSSEQGRSWSYMLQRCYYYDREIYATYKDCTVCNEWHNLQTFGKWYDETHPADGIKYQLDKDLKVIGNRVYSPDTCIWLPAKLNGFFVRALNPDSGIQQVRGKYRVRVSNYSLGGSAWTHLGYFEDKYSAVSAYVSAKREILLKLKSMFPQIEGVVFNNMDTLLNSKLHIKEI